MRVLRAAVRRGEASDVQPLWIDDSIALRARPALIAQLRRRADVRGDRARPHPADRAGGRRRDGGRRPVVPRRGDGRAGAVGAGPDRPRRRRRGARHGPRRRASLSSRPRLAPGSTPTSSTRRPSTRTRAGTAPRSAEIVVSMAPDVRIIAARVFSDGGRSTTSAVHRVFEWVLDPDGNPRPTTRPSVVNGSWDDGGPAAARRSSTATSRRCAPPASSRSSPPATAGPAAELGREPRLGAGRRRRRQRARAPTSSPPSRGAGRRRAETPSTRRSRPTARGSRSTSPGGAAVVSGTSFAAPQVTGAVALLAAHVPGRDARCDRRRTRARRARRRDARAATPIRAPAILDVAQAAALLAGADHAGPRVTMQCALVEDSAHRGSCSSGARTSAAAARAPASRLTAFISLRGVPVAPDRRSRSRRSTAPTRSSRA